MSACELCWAEAFRLSRIHGGSQVEHYKRLLVVAEGQPGHIADSATTPTTGVRGGDDG